MIEKRGREWTRFDLVTLHYPAECNGFRVHLREEIRELQKAGSGIPEQKSPTVGLNVILALFSTWRECDLPLPPAPFLSLLFCLFRHSLQPGVRSCSIRDQRIHGAIRFSALPPSTWNLDVGQRDKGILSLSVEKGRRRGSWIVSVGWWVEGNLFGQG